MLDRRGTFGRGVLGTRCSPPVPGRRGVGVRTGHRLGWFVRGVGWSIIGRSRRSGRKHTRTVRCGPPHDSPTGQWCGKRLCENLPCEATGVQHSAVVATGEHWCFATAHRSGRPVAPHDLVRACPPRRSHRPHVPESPSGTSVTGPAPSLRLPTDGPGPNNPGRPRRDPRPQGGWRPHPGRPSRPDTRTGTHEAGRCVLHHVASNHADSDLLDGAEVFSKTGDVTRGRPTP